MLFMTLANKITSLRFLLCIVYYVLLSLVVREAEPATPPTSTRRSRSTGIP